MLCAMLGSMTAAAASPEITDERSRAEYWISRNKDGEELIMTPSELEALNERMQEEMPSLTDLTEIPGYLAGSNVRERIASVAELGDFTADEELPEVYEKGRPLTKTNYARALANCNTKAVPASVEVRCGVATRRGNLRLLPVTDGWFDDAKDLHYDALQATAVDPAEPLLILTDSADGNFSFVIMRNYSGWLLKDAFAETSREDWNRYVEPKDFAVVTANKKYISSGKNSQLYQMGAKIPLSKKGGRRPQLMMLLPQRRANGWLEVVKVPAVFDDTLHHGFLSCTKNNFLRQGFRFLGDEYGWGGLDDSVDCSAFVGDVYRSMGIELPRDANVQDDVLPKRFVLKGSTAERLKELKKYPTGTLLANDYHIMMYLGEDDTGTPMVLQSMSSWFSFKNGKREKHYNRRVIVSTVEFLDSRGEPYINGVDSLSALE